ncbi:unnamed protein product [Dracunculus medinensis]|uniref:CAP-Gly domain-containing protein n=1 Tax=Dracunculus medinensis TaxID=318479 RepID=A0A0N4U9Y6_DRAME|nr:unnamed protein product [Dracunculus medinensis]
MRLFVSLGKESIISAVSKVGDWEIGDRCQIEKRIGSIVYIGPTNFAPGEWIGLVLDKPLGKNDGSVDGQRYFTCAPNHGLFCKASKLERIQSSVSEIIPENPYTKEFGFDVGDRVVVSGGKIGTIRYLGNTDFQDGIWAGIELDQPVGKNDGSVQIRHTKTSALRQRSGSHESLASIGASSIASSRISKFSFAPQRNIQRPIVLSSARGLDELVTTLQDSLKEKEKHLEQMIKERDLERNEMARLSNHCEEVEAKLALFEGQMTGSTHSAILEDKLINLKSRNATVEAENQDLMLEVKEKTEKIDELTFLLEEKEIMCAEISEKLAEVNKTDVEKKSKVRLKIILTLKNSQRIISSVKPEIFFSVNLNACHFLFFLSVDFY